MPSLLIVDGQQRLTSLFAVFRGKKVLDEDYRERQIEVAFRPRDGKFEVADAAIRRDPEWIANVSDIWASGKPSYQMVKGFLKQLEAKGSLSAENEERIAHNLDRLFDLQKYPFTALEIAPTVDEEQVADIVNALVHRDYAIKGAKCQLVVTPDTITVKSPGKPVEPITLEQMQSFDAPMLSRNPVLHYVFARMDLAEERGLGLRSMKARAEAAGLPLPRYVWQAPYLVLTLYRSAAGAVRALSPEVLDLLNADEKASWQFIVGREFVTSPVLMEQMGFDERKAQRVLKKLQDVGLLRRVGRGPATRYEVVRP